MSYLRASRIDLNQIRIPRLGLKHKIEPVKSRQLQPPSNFLSCRRHLRMVDPAHDRCVTRRAYLPHNLKVKTRENTAFPANECTGCFVSGHEGLSIYSSFTTG